MPNLLSNNFLSSASEARTQAQKDRGAEIIAKRMAELMESAQRTYSRFENLKARTNPPASWEDDPLWISQFAERSDKLEKEYFELGQRLKEKRERLEKFKEHCRLEELAFLTDFDEWLLYNRYDPEDANQEDYWGEFMGETGRDYPTIFEESNAIEEYNVLAQLERQMDELESRIESLKEDYVDARRADSEDAAKEAEELRNQLRENMHQLNYSATDTAELLNISPAKMGKILRGEQAIPDDFVENLRRISPRLAKDLVQMAGSDYLEIYKESLFEKMGSLTVGLSKDTEPTATPSYCKECRKETDSKVVSSAKNKVKGPLAEFSIRDRKRVCEECGSETESSEVNSAQLNDILLNREQLVRFHEGVTEVFARVRETVAEGGPEANDIGPVLTELAISHLPYEESMAALYPHLAKFYEEELTGPSYHTVWPYSSKVYDWYHDECDHSWSASPAYMISREEPERCPICAYGDVVREQIAVFGDEAEKEAAVNGQLKKIGSGELAKYEGGFVGTLLEKPSQMLNDAKATGDIQGIEQAREEIKKAAKLIMDDPEKHDPTRTIRALARTMLALKSRAVEGLANKAEAFGSLPNRQDAIAKDSLPMGEADKSFEVEAHKSFELDEVLAELGNAISGTSMAELSEPIRFKSDTSFESEGEDKGSSELRVASSNDAPVQIKKAGETGELLEKTKALLEVAETELEASLERLKHLHEKGLVPNDVYLKKVESLLD